MTGFKTTNAVIQHIMGIDSKYPDKIGIKDCFFLKVLNISFTIVSIFFVIFKNSAIVTPEKITIHSTEKMLPRPDVIYTMIK